VAGFNPTRAVKKDLIGTLIAGRRILEWRRREGQHGGSLRGKRPLGRYEGEKGKKKKSRIRIST